MIERGEAEKYTTSSTSYGQQMTKTGCTSIGNRHLLGAAVSTQRLNSFLPVTRINFTGCRWFPTPLRHTNRYTVEWKPRQLSIFNLTVLTSESPRHWPPRNLPPPWRAFWSLQQAFSVATDDDVSSNAVSTEHKHQVPIDVRWLSSRLDYVFRLSSVTASLQKPNWR